LVNGLIDIQL